MIVTFVTEHPIVSLLAFAIAVTASVNLIAVLGTFAVVVFVGRK